MENFRELLKAHDDQGLEAAIHERQDAFHKSLALFAGFLDQPFSTTTSTVLREVQDVPEQGGSTNTDLSETAVDADLAGPPRPTANKRSTSPPRPAGYKFLKRPGPDAALPLLGVPSSAESAAEQPTSSSSLARPGSSAKNFESQRKSAIGEGRLADFELRWESRRPFGAKAMSWTDYRGPFGETVPQLLYAMHIRDEESFPGRAAEYHKLLLDILPAAPQLAGVERTEEPYAGQTLLHDACAHGDEVLVAMLVRQLQGQNLNLEARAHGLFLQAISKSHLPGNDPATESPTIKGKFYGQTALEVAMFAPRSTEISLRLVTLLVQAGARMVHRIDEETAKQAKPRLYHQETGGGAKREDGIIHYTVLHSIARGRWSWPGPYMMTEERVTALTKLFLDPRSELSGHVGPGIRDIVGETPLQIAARLGNVAAFTQMLDWMKVVVWEWGNQMQYAFPLAPLDSGPKGASSLSALEQATLTRQHDVISIGLMGGIIHEKWKRFGLNHLLAELFVTFSIMFCLGIVCTRGFENAGTFHPMFLSACRWIGVVFSTMHLSFYLVLGVMSRKEPFFSNLSLLPWGCKGSTCNPSFIGRWMHKRFNIFPDQLELLSIYPVRNFLIILLMLFCLLSAPWSHPLWLFHSGLGVPTDRIIWEVGAAVAWICIAIHSSSFFLLFKFTAPLAATLPGVFWHDFRPFVAINSVLFLCICISLRIAMATTAHEDDPVFGNWWRTMLTMEEAIHGPDVQWRNAVFGHHPALAGLIFIVALWVWLIMLTVLVTLFSDRYEKLNSIVRQRILYQRAIFIISWEKLVPFWWYRACDLRMGKKLGGVVFEDYHRALRKRKAWQTQEETHRLLLGDHDLDEERIGLAASRFADTDEESQRLLPNARWLAWQGEPAVIGRWKESYVPESYEYFL